MDKESNRWTLEKARTCERMYEAGDTTLKIASVVHMSRRSVQHYIKDHSDVCLGDPWVPFEQNKRPKSNKQLLLERKVQEIIEEDCTLTRKMIIGRLPEALKCGLKQITRTLRTIGYYVNVYASCRLIET